ncbi:MAG: hypothetical protein J6U85_05555 [Bacteroidales bacterium]|nr:hypothetical protein [Bacteroidales bacterium]
MFSDGKEKYNRILLNKIESFIKKFYLNKLIQGALIGSVMLILFFLIFNGIEYFSWLSGKIRLILFITLISIFSLVSIFYFIIPITNLIRFRKKMSDKEAAVLIGKFFPEIKDKLLNTLQLTDSINGNSDNELLLATIEQRTKNLQTFNFSDAVNLKENYKYLKIFGISFTILIALIIFFPDFSQKPVERIINYDKSYEKPLPFQVSLQAKEIEVTQGDDFEFKIQVTGEKIPEKFYVNTSVGTRMMTKLSINEFSYVFNNIYQSENFQVTGGEYVSPEIKIIVNPSPTLLHYETELNFPKYINRKKETLSGKTRILVPQGTEVKFIFHTKDVETMSVLHDSINHNLKSEGNDFIYNFKALQNSKFYVNISNKWSESNNPIPFTIEVIPDAYPEIQVQAFNENFSKQTYYSGLIADDYGFTKLLYHFEVENKPNQSFVKRININKKEIRNSFYYSIDLDTITIYPGDEIKSYFEVWDNDGINGSKSRRSELFHISIPTHEILDSIADSTEENIISRLEDKTNNLEELRKDIEEIIKDLMSKKELDWTDKEKIKELIEKQKEIQEEWEKVQEEQKDLQDFMKENELTSEDLLKKQEEINKLFEEVIPEEMKKLMEEIDKMLGEMPREKMQQMMQDLKKSNKELQEMMDRNLSLLEQLKVEKDLNELIDKMNELSEKLQNANENNNDSLSAKDAENQFNKLSQELDSIMEKNKGLQEPFNISKDEKMEDEINQDLEEAGEMEENGDDSGSSQKKNDAGKKMKQMAEKLSMDMMMGGMEQMGEDAHLVRILLENVVRSSHEEESLMNEVGKMKKDDPSLSNKISRQKEIADNFTMVEDSLRKMAMRQPKIKNFVFTELQLIDQQLGQAMKEMNEMTLASAASRQQRAMMSMNNLALMLAESLNDMNESMMEASGSCSKPKNSKKPSQGKQSMKKMKDLQEQLGKQLEQLRKEMQQQQKDGKPQQSMSKEFAKMAAEQEMLREGMQKMLEEMKKDGLTGDDGINEIIKDMEKLEEDLVNKKISSQTMKRNRDILSRMLKAQNAQEEREKEEKRKSEEFKGSFEKRNINELEYQENLKKQQEFLKMNSIEYQPFYREKINDYFFKKNINETKE